MTGPALAAIRAGLDRVGQAGRRLPVWWRDDDAVRHTPALDRLFGLSRRFAIPVAVATVPALVEPSLVARVRAEPGARVLVHGWRHANHAPAGEKSAEFGPHRPAAGMASELRRGRETIRSAFGSQALDVFVPPWNRIGPGAAELLAGAGYHGLSTFGLRTNEARGTLSPGGRGQGEGEATSPDSALPPHPVGFADSTSPPRGEVNPRSTHIGDGPLPTGRGFPRSSSERNAPSPIVTIDTHIDPIDWRGTRGLAPPERIAARFVQDLSGWLEAGSRAAGRPQTPEEPIGLLTHHLAMDEATWSFCEELIETVLSHSSAYTPELDRLWRIGQPT